MIIATIRLGSSPCEMQIFYVTALTNHSFLRLPIRVLCKRTKLPLTVESRISSGGRTTKVQIPRYLLPTWRRSRISIDKSANHRQNETTSISNRRCDIWPFVQNISTVCRGRCRVRGTIARSIFSVFFARIQKSKFP